MTIGDSTGNHLTLTFSEGVPWESPCLFAFALDVEISSHRFSARSGIWVSYSEFDSFLAQLRTFEERRIGTASFHGMSDDCFVSIGAPSPTRLVTVSGYLTCPAFDDRETFLHRLEFGFGIEQQFILQLVSDFAALVPVASRPKQSA